MPALAALLPPRAVYQHNARPRLHLVGIIWALRSNNTRNTEQATRYVIIPIRRTQATRRTRHNTRNTAQETQRKSQGTLNQRHRTRNNNHNTRHKRHNTRYKTPHTIHATHDTTPHNRQGTLDTIPMTSDNEPNAKNTRQDTGNRAHAKRKYESDSNHDAERWGR
jgi:hypothetical protein